MKLKVRVAEMGRIASTGSLPESHRVTFTPNGEEDAKFVAVGPVPGRHMPIIRLSLEGLTAAAATFDLNEEYVLTLERIVQR